LDFAKNNKIGCFLPGSHLSTTPVEALALSSQGVYAETRELGIVSLQTVFNGSASDAKMVRGSSENSRHDRIQDMLPAVLPAVIPPKEPDEGFYADPPIYCCFVHVSTVVVGA
jgi:hypothetical protein